MNIMIIGGSTGIGAATIAQLNKEKHHTISINRSGNTEANEKFSCNVINEELPEITSPLDGIVYLPGTINLKPLRLLKEIDFRHDWEINFLGAVRVIQKYQSLLLNSQLASVVLFSTVAAQTGMAFHASIGSAKGAVEALTLNLAAEYAPKIRFNCIAPSLTLSPLSSRFTDNQTKQNAVSERHPLKKIGKPDDVASLTTWLLSEKSQFVTGQIFKMDGGLSGIR